MSTARRMHRLAPMARKSGRGGRGKQQVVDITPVILTEIRDICRDLSTRMDGFEHRMDDFREETRQEFAKLRQETHEEFVMTRGSADARFDLVERRLAALEGDVAELKSDVAELKAEVFKH